MKLSPRRKIITYSITALMLGGAILYADDPALGSANSLILAGACVAKPAGTPSSLFGPSDETSCPGTGVTSNVENDHDEDDQTNVTTTVNSNTAPSQAMAPTQIPTPTATPGRQTVTFSVTPVVASPSPLPAPARVVFIVPSSPQPQQPLPVTGGTGRITP